MDWTDLIDTAFRMADNSSQTNRTEAVHSIEGTVIDGEQPVASTAGRHPDHFRKGVLVLTTHRLLFLKDGKPPVPVPLSAVTGATVARTKLNGDVLTVVALTGSHRFEDVVKADVFAEQIRAAARAARTAPRPAPGVVAPSDTAPALAGAELSAGGQLLDQLERLAALHRSGALTDEEFTRAKERLIG
ncbi:SHOCT domain-containing protein [Streptomyces kaniharaensis]|uniref:SHOCT domain-containing protein n=1 Tax=Streptomyces kaniharaensis TaxID=212423 RepID=A0A6N7KSQ0_9ACTN|nr:SHOCT domain-containing protein [Streptomyces kaniharaensis]MQS12633.1 SHOCT domain-containing protein [Streptomyces kaniharaensis]